jgi:hypothetical protein
VPGCLLRFLALLLPHAVTICCLLSYAVVVAVFQLEPVPWLVDVALLFPRRDLPPRRKLLLDVVGNVRLVCFQWPAARIAVPAAVCACRCQSVFPRFSIADACVLFAAAFCPWVV